MIENCVIGFLYTIGACCGGKYHCQNCRLFFRFLRGGFRRPVSLFETVPGAAFGIGLLVG